jgi:hypothetical protein
MLLPKMELGVVMNIDLQSESVFKSHFDVAEGWASYIRVSSGIDQQGWRPDVEKLPLVRTKRLAFECAKRGWGMHVVLGGMPHPERWSETLGKPKGEYRYDRYGSMPKSWWASWVAYQKAAAKATVAAYGPGATSKIRFQLMNEPYARGEDDVVDELIRYAVPRLADGDGLVAGCPLDGPSLVSVPPGESLIDRFARLLKSDKLLDKVIKRVPFSSYPPTYGSRNVDVSRVIDDYVAHCRNLLKLGEAELRRPVYFSEVGVGVVREIPFSIFGSRTHELAERVLVESLDRLRREGVLQATIYQTRDHNQEDEQTRAYGLLDRFGRPRFDTLNLVRLARGEPVVEPSQDGN